MDLETARKLTEALNALGFKRPTPSIDRRSWYLSYPGSQFRLRLSDHRWPQRVENARLDVILTVIIGGEITDSEIASKAREYASMYADAYRGRTGKELVPPRGFEPLHDRLEGGGSIRLSYGGGR